MGTTPSEAVVPVIAKSASPMSFTFSLKVTRHVRVSALVGEVVGSWRTIEVTVGAVVSATDAVWLIDTCIAAVLPLPAASSATFAATFSVTVPVATGVIVAVKVWLSLVGFCRFEGAPLPTVMSPTAKPVTASSKVKVAVNGPVLVDAAVIVTVGAVLSSRKKLSFGTARRCDVHQCVAGRVRNVHGRAREGQRHRVVQVVQEGPTGRR